MESRDFARPKSNSEWTVQNDNYNINICSIRKYHYKWLGSNFIPWILKSRYSEINGTPSKNPDTKTPLVAIFSPEVVIHFSPLAALMSEFFKGLPLRLHLFIKNKLDIEKMKSHDPKSAI